MSVKRCPTCGDLYLAAVDSCASCGTVLVAVEEPSAESSADERGESEVPTPQEVAGDRLQWALDSWTMEGRRLLDGMLASADIPRAWQGATLVAPATVRDTVDGMVEVVARGDARVGVDDGTLAELDAAAEEGDTVGYEVSGWSSDALDRLEERLVASEVPYGWDADGDLVVAVAHEDVVDGIFDALSGGADEDDDGPAALETLSDLFLAADRLARNPDDGAAARALASTSVVVEDMALPFGFAPGTWSSIIDQATELSRRIEAGDPDEEPVTDAATTLRETLRDYV